MGKYLNDLQTAFQLGQKWAAVNGKSKDLVVAQSHEARCFSWSFCISLNPEGIGSNRCTGQERASRQRRTNHSFLHSPFVGHSKRYDGPD